MIYDIDGNVISADGGGANAKAINEKVFNNISIALDENMHDIPQNRAVYLTQKRIKQLKNLQWTALSDVPDAPAGNHTGMVYSSVKELDKYVGYNVSIRTFMTAVHNPYSLLYTEAVYNGGKSGYGFTYHGTNCGAYFGAVCNTYALYGIGMPIDYNTAEFAYLSDIGVFEKIADQTAGGFRVGDIVWEPGHGNIITDIVRDEHGTPTTIVWSEEVHSFPATHSYTLEQAQNRLTNNGGIIYRYTDLFKSLNYEPSPFVAVDDEVISTPYVYNDDICTYAGDYAAFYEGEPVHINYAKGSYTSMQLYKGDSLIQTITLPSSYNATHSVNVTSYLTGYGKYKARLTGSGGNSDYTYFEVIQTNVSVSKSGNNLTVNFSSANGTPQYVQLTYRNGKSRGIYALSAEEIAAGTCTFNAATLALSQSYTDGFTETTYVKVFFIGDYGIVRNDWLNSGLR